MVAQCECTKWHWNVHFKMVNFWYVNFTSIFYKAKRSSFSPLVPLHYLLTAQLVPRKGEREPQSALRPALSQERERTFSGSAPLLLLWAACEPPPRHEWDRRWGPLGQLSWNVGTFLSLQIRVQVPLCLTHTTHRCPHTSTCLPSTTHVSPQHSVP